MTQPFILSPRYRLDDESAWLVGIDPARYYWISVNADATTGRKVGRLESWKVGRLESWKVGKLEGWKV